MLDLGTLKISIRADAAKAEKELKGFQEQTEDVEKTSEDVAESIGESWENLGKKLNTALNIGAITAGLGTLVETANETQEDIGKLTTAFEQSGYSVETANEVYEDFVGLLGETDTAVEASNHLAKLCKSEEELAKWGDIAAGVYTTFGDSLPLEGLTEAANETAKTGKVTGSLADALNWAGINEDEFNQILSECNTESERATKITETLSDTYSDAGEKYRDNNEDLIDYRESQAKLNETLSELGMTIMPVVSDGMRIFSDVLSGSVLPWLEGIGDIISGVLDWFDSLDDGTKNLLTTLGKIAVAAKPLASVFSSLRKNLPDVVSNMKSFFKINKNGAGGVSKSASSSKALGGAIDLIAGVLLSVALDAIMDYFNHMNDMKKATDDVKKAVDDVPASLEELSDAAEESSDSVSGLLDEADEATQRMIDFGESVSDTFGDIEDKGTVLNGYIDTIEKLAGKSGLTADEQIKLKQAIDGVNEICGTNYEVIDSANGILSDSTEVIKDNTQAWYDNATAQAAYNAMVEAQEEVFKLESLYDSLEKKRSELQDRLDNGDISVIFDLFNTNNSLNDVGSELDTARESVESLSKTYESCASTISQFLSQNEGLSTTLSNLGIDINTASNTLSDFGLTATDVNSLTSEQLSYLVSNAGASAQDIANKFKEMGWQVPESMRDMLTNAGIALDENGYIVTDAASDVASEAAQSMDKSDESKESGVNTAQSFVYGVAGEFHTASVSGSQIGTAAANAMDKSGEAQGTGSTMSLAFASGVNSGSGQANSSGISVANSAKSGMQSNNSSASGWGSHLVENFASGIRGAIDWVVGAASEVANAVSSILGHSIPEEGILSNGGKGEIPWGEHLVQNIAKGMLNAKSDIVYAANEIADAVATPLSDIEAPINFTSGQAGFNSYLARRTSNSAVTSGSTYITYYIGDTKVDTITEQKFAEEFIGLMTKYGRLAVT